MKFGKTLMPPLMLPALAAGVIVAGAAYKFWRYATRGYRIHPVDFESDGVHLRGSLYLPTGPGPHPGIVLVHGMFLGLRSFYRFYADFFARLGFAALIYDKRGSGASEGRSALLGLEQQARDAAAGWYALRVNPQIDENCVGFWGYSLGGAATLRAADLVEQPGFVIGLSQPALPLGEVLTYYKCGLLAGGLKREARQLRSQLWHFSRSGRGWKRLFRQLSAAKDKLWYRAAGLPQELDPPSPQTSESALRNPEAQLPFRWGDEDLDYDPLPLLAKLNCPILLQYGDRDLVVPSREFMLRVQAFRAAHYIPQLTVCSYPGGDHAMHHPWLPFNQPLCFYGSYLDDMKQWLRSVAGMPLSERERRRRAGRPSALESAALTRY